MTPGEVGTRAWSPSAWLVGWGWAGAVAAAAWCTSLVVTDADPAGLLIAGVAAVGLALGALFGTRARPRLRADEDGLTVAGLLGSRHHPWPLVRDIRVLRVRRLGLSSALLEVDTVDLDGGERLLVFGRLDLADDPEDVAVALDLVRPPGHGPRPLG